MSFVSPRWERGKSLCAYCSSRLGTPADHVIPKNLFIVKDQEMLTVPACVHCQKAKGRGEKDLWIYCNVEVGGSQHPDAFEQIRRIIEKTDEATRNWLERAIEEAEEVILVDEEDNEVGRVLAPDFTTDRIIDTLKFMFRGLFYVTRGQQLPEEVPVEATIVPWMIFPEFMRRMGAFRKHEPIIKGKLVAWWSELGPIDTGPKSTAWVLCVNDGVGFSGFTGDLAIGERQRKEEMAKADVAARNGPRRIRAPRDAQGRLIIPPQ